MRRGDAILAYVAVTRAKSRLDSSGLAWINSRAHVATAATPAAAAKEAGMNAEDPLTPGTGRPYARERTQAESGCQIIAGDHDNWTTVTAVPAEHPLAVQLAQAWRAVVKRDIDDDPGPAGNRYRAVAHAASTIACDGDVSLSLAETMALERGAAAIAA